jgi:hypothetical protein
MKFGSEFVDKAKNTPLNLLRKALSTDEDKITDTQKKLRFERRVQMAVLRKP